MSIDPTRIGGSDCAAVLGLSRYGTPLSVYGRLVQGFEKEDTGAMSAGRALEPVVLAEYARRTGRAMDLGVQVERLPFPWMRANLDARSCLPGGPLRVVEGKTGSWRVRGEWGEPGTGDVPQEYLLQVQFYLGVGLASGEVQDEVADVPAYLGGEWAGVWQMKHDAELYGLILQGLERFWVDHVEPRREPPATGLSADAEYIRRRWPEHRSAHLDWAMLTEEQQHLVWSAKGARAHRQYAEGLDDLWSAKLKTLLGEASGVSGMPDGSRLDWKTDAAGKRSLRWFNEGRTR